MKTVASKPVIVVTPFVLIAAVLQFAIPAISSIHPSLAHLLSLVSIVCCLAMLFIWAAAFGTYLIGRRGKAIQTWRDLWSHLRFTRKKASTIVSVAQLTHLRDQVQRLGLALHGLTPEQELARRTHFQMHGEEVPPLVLPQQNAVLYAEYDGLVKTLTYYGFPNLVDVCLEHSEFEFFLRWERDLAMRLRQSQQRFQDQQNAIRLAMAAVKHLHQSIGETYPGALTNAGYLRLQGALKVLEKMSQDNRSSGDLIQSCLQKLGQDLDTLAKELQQKVA